MTMYKEFKDFVIKGNVVDLAVAVIIGAAFGRIVTALVDNILMPIIGSFVGKNFESLTAVVNGVELKYGLFIQRLVDFVLIALVLFVIIKIINRVRRKDAEIEAAPPAPSTTEKLLMEIRDALQRP
ncbi:MAG: large conductance mechanosensitive channel protein MscL [Flavitalea sp.]